MKLVKPTLQNKNEIEEMIEEFISNKEFKMNGSSKAEKYSYEEWISYLNSIEHLNEELIQKGYVATIQYVLYDNNLPVGFFCARQKLTPKLLEASGHIGYSIRPSKRRKGYATSGVKLLLNEYKKVGISRVLVCCFKNNIASANTIVKCGGVLESEVKLKEGIVQRYWIECK